MTAIAKRLGEWKQVVIMNPHDIIGLKKLVQFRGEGLVDPHIAAQITAGEFRQIQPVM